MRLILSSCDFSGEKSKKFILDHLPKAIEFCRVLFIPNEKATTEKILSGKYHQRLMRYGFSRENISVFDPIDIDQWLGIDLDVIYVSGGNTFLILQKLQNCGFDRELIRYIETGVTYIGGSAGAHLVTKNLAHVARYDSVPPEMACLDGLGMFEGILLCHYNEQRRAHYDLLKAQGTYKVYTLTDEESILIEK